MSTPTSQSLLAGKVGLIVGIANERSYAWHIAKALLEHGATCAFTHLPGERNEHRTRRSIDALPNAGAAIAGPAAGKKPWVAAMDASNDAELDATFAKFVEGHDRLDFLIHSIAFAERDILQPGKFVTTTRQQYLQAIDISAYTLLAMATRARPLMARPKPGVNGGKGGGSILGMSYYGAEKVLPGYNVMGVAKAALECTGRYLASELGEDGIRVNLISGGYLKTLASSAVGGTDAMSDAVEKHAPLRRNVEGADVGGTAVWLCSDLSAGVTGETIYVDCGVNIVAG
ncbi:MAG: enoyl-ACP reductase [Phycisphaerales bacterium]